MSSSRLDQVRIAMLRYRGPWHVRQMAARYQLSKRRTRQLADSLTVEGKLAKMGEGLDGTVYSSKVFDGFMDGAGI